MAKKKEKIKDDWKKIEGTFYCMNSQGILINNKGKMLKPYKNDTGVYYYIYTTKKKKCYIYVKDVYKQLFGKDKKFDSKWYLWALKIYQILTPKSKNPYHMPKIYKRRCHDCGRPTNNYRCKACWERIRGKKKKDEGEFYGLEPDIEEYHQILLGGDAWLEY